MIATPIEKVKPAYVCDRCDEIHDYYDAAADCCRPRVLNAWKCVICNRPHHTESEAIACFDACREEKGEPEPVPEIEIPNLPGDCPLAVYIAEFHKINRLKEVRA